LETLTETKGQINRFKLAGDSYLSILEDKLKAAQDKLENIITREEEFQKV